MAFIKVTCNDRDGLLTEYPTSKQDGLSKKQFRFRLQDGTRDLSADEFLALCGVENSRTSRQWQNIAIKRSLTIGGRHYSTLSKLDKVWKVTASDRKLAKVRKDDSIMYSELDLRDC